MKTRVVASTVLLVAGGFLVPEALGFKKPLRSALANYDKRQAQPSLPQNGDQSVAKTALQARLPTAKVEFDRVTQAPKLISAADGFLTGPNGAGRAIPANRASEFSDDPHRATKLFLKEHQRLFGHGPEILVSAKVKREFVTP